jgi:hypothetical protein
MPLLIANNLLLLGSATFNSITSTGFTTLNYSQTTAGSIVTLKAGVTYTVTGQLTITGTGLNRCTLQSDTKFSATGTIGPTSNQLACPITLNPVLASKPAGSEYLVSQSPANLPLLRRGIPGLNGSDTTSLASFPSITAATGGSGTPFTLSKSATVSSRLLQVGLTAKFIHSAAGGDAARNLNFVTTFDIDSRTSLGTVGTIKANNSYQNKVGIPNPNLWRTINWDSLVPLAPLVTVAYIE